MNGNPPPGPPPGSPPGSPPDSPPPVGFNGTSDHFGPPAELAPLISKANFYNNIFAGCLSIPINALLIFVIISRLTNTSKPFQKLLIISTVLEIFYSTCSMLASPVLTSIDIRHEFIGLLIVNVGWNLNHTVNQALLMAYFVLLTQLIFISPYLYYFRFAQVCRKGSVGCATFALIITLNIILLVMTSAFLCYSSLPSSTDIEVMEDVADSFTGTTSAFLLLSYTRNNLSPSEKIDKILSIISALSYVISLLLSIFVMIYCSVRMNMKIHESNNMSSNLMALQKKMNRVLLTQFFCPLIFIQLPFFYSVLGPLAGASQGLQSDMFPMLFAWSPVFNTLIIFILNSEVRNALFRKPSILVASDHRRSLGTEH